MSQEKELPCQCPDGCKVHEIKQEFNDEEMYEEYLRDKAKRDKTKEDNLVRRISRTVVKLVDRQLREDNDKLVKIIETRMKNAENKPEPFLYRLPESIRAEALESKIREIGKENEKLREKLNEKDQEYRNIIQQLMVIKALMK